MEIIRSIRLKDEEGREVKFIMESSNQARDFFNDDEHRAVCTLGAGHDLCKEHLVRGHSAIFNALQRVKEREPHGAFPAELKEQYETNLKMALNTVENWISFLD